MDMKDKVLGWFGTGWVGSSSKAMALASCGAPGLKDHPYDPVSYTHLDVYKRQEYQRQPFSATNPMRVRLAKACQTCPHRRGGTPS